MRNARTVDTLPSGALQVGGFRSALAGFRLSLSCPFRLLHGTCVPHTFQTPSSPRGITPAFGYGAPHSSARGTSTLLSNALLSAHYGPLRFPAGPPRRLCLPSARWSLSLPPCRTSQAPRRICPRALSPTTPEGPLAARACCFTIGLVWLHPSRRTGHLRIPIEAESGLLALRLACSPPESPAPLLALTLVRLHAEQAIYMVNSFQFTRSARLILVTDRQGAVGRNPARNPHFDL